MDYSFDSDVLSWSFDENSLLRRQRDLVDEKIEQTICEQSNATINHESSMTICEEPTYINICYENQPQISLHFGDRFKGVFMFLRETNSSEATITSLQHDVETVLNAHSNCDLTTGNDEQFEANIVVFATMIDHRLRQIKRHSEQQFNAVSSRLTKLEKKQRTRSNTVFSLEVLRKLIRRLFMGRRP